MSLSTPFSNELALRTARAVIDARLQAVCADLQSAAAKAQYSKVAGYGGMRSALEEALVLVDTHAQATPRPAAQALTNTLMRRQLECDSARDDALNSERYEEVSAMDGRGTGFLIALRIVQDELQPARGNVAARRAGPQKRLPPSAASPG